MTASALALQLEPAPTLVDLLERELARRTATPTSDGARLPLATWEAGLHGPLREYLARPGKAFRAELTHLGWQLAGQRGEAPAELPLIIEALHAGSLVIDDIEDGSAWRRGGPALHVTTGVPRALNAGNWLYFWALALLERLGLPPATELALHRAFGRTLLECHDGQALDLSVRITEVPQAELGAVVATTTELKTGALMGLAATLGALAGGATQERARHISAFARDLGSGLQMLDDLGGLTSERRAHKGHEDLLHARPTWPWAWAAAELDAAEFARLVELARSVVARATHPEVLAEALRERIATHGRERIHQHLTGALAALGAHPGMAAALGPLRLEIERLEQSFS